MKQDKYYIDYLQDILSGARKALEFIEGIDEREFLLDDKTAFAVIRAIEIVGEATKKIPSVVRNKYPDIPWREMAGIRDKLVHDYFGVNLKVIWKTVKEDIPGLIESLQVIVEQEKPE